jgi:probable F420-dependent oxidoreductase
MRIGTVYPHTELGGNPDSLRRFAGVAEDLGYDHLMVYDHVVGIPRDDRDPPPVSHYDDSDSFHDPMTAFAFLAGITDRINFVSGILILPQRQTVVVAKQATDIDLFSGGRLRLGVGVGVNYVEYDALGQDFHTRGKRLTEQIHYLRRLWSEPLLSFDGEFDRLDRANINPRPRRRIPIYCGGFSEAAFRRAARLADGFIYAVDPVEAEIPSWQRTQELLQEEGRSVTDFEAIGMLQDSSIRGLDIPEAVDAARRWSDAGGTCVTVVTCGRDYRSLDEHIDHISALREKVGDIVSG